MIVRGEKLRLLDRFKSLVVLTTSLSVVGGALFAYGNHPFVDWWTHGRISWPAINNVLLAGCLAFAMLARSHMGLAGLTKEFRFLRYVYLLEGVFFVLISSLVLRGSGMTAMIYVALAASLVFSFPYGIWRSAEYFGLPWKTVALEWIRPSLTLALLLVPFVALFWCFTRSLSAWLQLAGIACILGPVSGLLFLRYGLDSGLAQEVKRRLPERLLPRWLLMAGD